MTSSGFIIHKLEHIAATFPNSRIRYKYDDGALVHLIELKPDELYRSPELEELEMNLIFEFVDLYPEENITFIQPDSVLGLEDEDWRYEQLSYNVRNHSARIHSYSCILPSANMEMDWGHIDWNSGLNNFALAHSGEFVLSRIHSKEYFIDNLDRIVSRDYVRECHGTIFQDNEESDTLSPDQIESVLAA